MFRSFVYQRKPTFLTVLLVPMIVFGCILAAVVAYTSLYSSQQQLDDAAERLRTEVNTRIEDHLNAFLSAPMRVTEMVDHAIQHGRLAPADMDGLSAYFFEMVQLFPTIISVTFGFPDGGLVNIGREGFDQQLYVISTESQAAGPFSKHAAAASGQVGILLGRVPHFDATTRPWYQQAVQHEGPVWSDPYLRAASQDMGLAVSRPVYSTDGQLLGVISVDLFLGHLTDFLRQLNLSQGQRSLILDQEGRLLASAYTGGLPETTRGVQSSPTPAVASGHELTRSTVNAWQEQLVASNGEQGSQVAFAVNYAGKHYLGHASAYSLGSGISWQIVTTMPYDQVVGGADARRAWTLGVIVLALAVVLAIGVWLTRRIVRPIETLDVWAGSLANGPSDSFPITESWIREVDELGQSLTSMSAQLQATIRGLKQEIDERQLTEALLRDSRERYRQLTDDLPAMICEYEPDGTLTYVNQAYCEYHETSAEELLGLDLLQFWPEATRQQGRLHLFSLSPEAPTNSSVHHVLRHGEVRWQEWRGRGFFDADGQLLRIQAIGFDITERKQMEDALRQSEERYRSIITVSNTGAWEYHREEQSLWCSEEYYSMLGRSLPKTRVDATGNVDEIDAEWLALIHPDDQEPTIEAFTRYLQEAPEIMYENTFRMQHQDGHWVWIWSRGQTLRDRDGQPTNLTVGTHIDITELMAMEQALIREKEQFRTTLLSVGEGIISTDSCGRIVVSNDRAQRLTGYSLEESLGRTLSEVFRVQDYTTDSSDGAAAMRHLSETGGEQQGLVVTKHGARVFVEFNTTDIRDEQGAVTGTVLVFRDITERKERQEEIEFLSYYDPLTGLYNRRFFEEELRRMDVERNLPLSLLIVDVNGLKLINDAFGHQAGDRLLQSTAAALQAVCRADDVMARIGGDEFMVLLPNTGSDAVSRVSKRIWDRVQSQNIEGVPVSVSCGSSTKVDNKYAMDKMYKDAEDAMYRHKISDRTSHRHTSIELIMKALYEKTPREQEHSRRVGQLCARLAVVMGLDQIDVNELMTAGNLHDIGKVAIGDQILDKAGPLTPKEWQEMKRHPEIGFNILSEVNDYARLANYVLGHHERWDGRGYPNGWTGDAIPLQARIMAVCDTYDAMTSSRPYRAAMSPEAALAEIEACLGTQLDPVVGRHFLELMRSDTETS